MTTMEEIPYGTQLAFWEDYPSEENIIFDVTYCVNGCPFDSAFEAKGDGTRIFVQQFRRPFISGVLEPTKYLLAVYKETAHRWSDRTSYYIANDYWEVIYYVKDLTGRYPLWRMSKADQDLPSNMGGH